MSNIKKCSCWDEKDGKLKELGFQISTVCSALIICTDGVAVKRYLPLQRVDGKKLKRSDPSGISISYCPFCGQSLEEPGEDSK